MKGLDVYKKAQAASAHVDVRQAEADALLRVAREMEAGQDGPSRVLFDALLRNIQLWNIFAQDCVAEGNQLPRDLRAQIVSLAVWVVGQSEKAISGDVGVAALIEINRMIARGLMTNSAEPSPVAPFESA